MKLYILLLVFLVCLYINYRVTVPVYEGFDTVGVVMNTLGGLFVFAMIIGFIVVIMETFGAKRNNVAPPTIKTNMSNTSKGI
jgi:hypothetical protein